MASLARRRANRVAIGFFLTGGWLVAERATVGRAGRGRPMPADSCRRLAAPPPIQHAALTSPVSDHDQGV